MPTDDLTAADMASGTADHGPLSSLPRDGATYTGHDVNGNETRCWFERGVLMQESALHVVWWSRP